MRQFILSDLIVMISVMIHKDKQLFTEPLVSGNGVGYIYEYFDADSFDHLDYARCKQTYGVCFVGDEIVIGFGGLKKAWGIIGGSIEQEETFEQTLRREIKEESNMEIVSFLPIGYQKVTDRSDGKVIFQLRYVCKVKPLGEFKIDGGDGMSEKGIIEIKLIDPSTYKEYFDWGKIGEHIIKRAIELKPLLK